MFNVLTLDMEYDRIYTFWQIWNKTENIFSD